MNLPLWLEGKITILPITVILQILPIFRRLRETIQNTVFETTQGSENFKIVIAGLSNVYTHYITTYEEYQRQRYEAASTIFGPHTLKAYQDQYTYLTEAILQVYQIKVSNFKVITFYL